MLAKQLACKTGLTCGSTASIESIMDLSCLLKVDVHSLSAGQSIKFSACSCQSRTFVLIQKRHPYTGNLNSEMPGDSKNAFLHCGDVLGC